MNSTAESAPTAATGGRRSGVSAYPTRWAAIIGALAVVALVLEHGFLLGPGSRLWLDRFSVLLALALGVVSIRALRRRDGRREVLREHRFEYFLLGVFVLLLLGTWVFRGGTAAVMEFLHLESRAGLRFGIVQLYLLANVFVQMLRLLQHVFVQGVRLELVLAGSFGLLIVLGTALLSLPRAGGDPAAPITLMDALFTATSAVCVTGLIVRDTGLDFSGLGQVIILILFQIGGLGIITFVAFVSVFSTRTLPVPQMVAFRQVIKAPGMNDLRQRLTGIVVLTILFETAGVIGLYGAFPLEEDPLLRLKWSVFHSVSAFCNAGFALQADSLEFAGGHAVINGIVMGLIVVGGLGFLVIPETIGWLRRKIRNARFWIPGGRRAAFRPCEPRFSVQTKMSLLVTFALIAVGFAGFWLLEGRHILGGRGMGESFLISLFQSITSRTAGFNTVTTGELQPATLIFLMMLMVIGGSPVSAAGGIKTVTFGVLLLALRSMIMQKDKVEVFGRTLPQKVLFTALSVCVLYMIAAALGTFLLSLFDPGVPLRDVVFEVISALSTVGLSTGITAELSTAGKLVLCAAMFIGRVGPIALVLLVFEARSRVEYEFPTEDVVVS